MGRRAKYLTADAKRAAKKAQAELYRQTEKGKEARRRENKRQNNKQQARKLTWVGVLVPLELYTRSQKTLRASFAVQEPGPLLGLWTSPYEFAMPDVSSLPTIDGGKRAKASVWNSCAAVLGAYQYGEVIETGWRRFEQWMADDLALDEIEAQVKEEVVGRVEAWVRLADSVTKDGPDVDVMTVGLDWGAKIIRMLVEEWEMRKDGDAGYREHRGIVAIFQATN
ncbi:uncharacterized protein TRAVEDRAFT_52911 [Trametes versicolor FP-101664 SS1]|uniref:uncharacterized protein n=1 Tax=Trametes versicolor (strain FP-101664) TaxID=717944 RepID=UPI00046232D3|nr:uncharacterized protein TRAVEDRAFT_52911 [Trametes versicolor FP-101664 SS1]EIW53787.1 hypothetical protein TRAVEDRAFT_52911 [Trametes versicolor FP-101664 SS1]